MKTYALITGTGSTTGLGHLLAMDLLGRGCHVIGWDRQPDTRTPYTQYEVDLTDPEAIRHGEDRLRQLISQPLDVLVNCAGIPAVNYLEDTPTEEWDMVFSVNVRAQMLTTQAFLEQLRKSQGIVCNIASDAAHKPMTASHAYCASKAASEMLTRTLARELTKVHRISVFGVSPARLHGTGMSSTVDDLVSHVRDWSNEEVRARQRESLLWGEEYSADDLANWLGSILTDVSVARALSGTIVPFGT